MGVRDHASMAIGLLFAATAACGDNLAASDAALGADAALVDGGAPDAPPDAGPAPAVVIRRVGGAPTESGGSATFAVRLTAIPSAAVVVPIVVDAPDEAAPALAQLTFSPADALVEQAVLLVGVDDDVDDGDQPVVLAAGLTTSADPAFAGLFAGADAVLNVDDDTAAIDLEVLSAMSTEGGEAAVVTVALASEPIADVTFTVASSDDSEASPSTTALVFTAATWNVAQQVVLTGLDDALDDGDVAYTVQLTPTSADPLYAALVAAAPALVNADDDDAGISVGPMTAATTEAGGTATFQLVLDSQPTADVAIEVATGDGTEGALAITTVTFTPADWDVVQDVTVTGVDDDLDDDDQPYQLLLGPSTSADPAYDGVTLAPVDATNLDDDSRGITVSAISTDTTEGGGTATFTVVLASEPTADVVLALGSDDATEGVADVAALTFTAATWDVAQTVTVTGQNDDVDDGDVAYAITFGAITSDDSGYVALTPSPVAARNIDDDTAGVIVSSASSATTEAGGTATFTVVLASEPLADVTFALQSDDAGEGVTDMTSLTFTAADWDTAQTVTVTGQDDAFDDDDVTYHATFGAGVSGDPRYAAITPTATKLTNVDDDTAGYVVTANGTTTTEAGATASFTVALTAAPQQALSLPLGSDDPSEGAADATALAFDADTWNVAQTVTVAGVDDDLDDGDVAYQIDFGAAVTADPAFAGTAPTSSVDLVTTDDDTAGLTVSAASGHTTEAGGTATFTVVLEAEPSADVVLDVLSANGSEGTAAPAPLTFTGADWDVPQTVTVTGVDDLVIDGDTAYDVDLGPATSADPAFVGLAATVALVNDDDDVPAVCGLASCWGGDTFEDGEIADWTIGADGGVINTLTAANGTTTSVIGLGASSTHQRGLRRTWAGCTPNKVSIWVNPTGNAGAHNYVVLGRAGATAVTGNVVFMYARAGLWRLVNGPNHDVIGTVPDVWTKVEITFDWTGKTYDATIGGTLVANDYAFRDVTATSLGQLDLYNFDSGTTGRWDEIEVYCD